MSVQELTVLHQRYIDLSDRFRAAWTFHQFLQGLQKIYLQPVTGRYPADFQNVYGLLKDVSHGLNASETGRIRQQLDVVDHQLVALTAALLQEDSKVAPSLLRQFFQRVKNYDEKILTQLLKFYLLAQRGGGWPSDQVDKADFLLTKLAEESPGSLALRDRGRLREIFRGLWALVDGQPAPPEELAARRAEVERLRGEVAEVEDLEQLTARDLVHRFRRFKHELGALLFEPETLLAVLETNFVVKQKVQQLYSQEERRIFAESQRIFELEREVPGDVELDRDLAQFRSEIERFERQLQDDDLQLDALANIRRQVQELIPRLTGTAKAGAPRASPPPSPPPPAVPVEQAEPFDSGQYATVRAASLAASDELIRDHLQRLVGTLEGTSRATSPKAVTVESEVFSFRLEAREVTAFRRLFGQEPLADGALEQFLLEAAALRVRINEEAEEITGILDDTAVTHEAPVFRRARGTGRLADAFVRRFSHAIDQAVLDGNFVEAQALQLLRMRLIRDYSGLWLLTNRPS
jgi:hypothetical protein